MEASLNAASKTSGGIAITLDIAFFAPFFQGRKKRINRFAHTGIACTQRWIVLMEEITAMLNNVVERQINETNIGLLIGFHQPFPQMINGGKLRIVRMLIKITVVEKRPLVIPARFAPILRMKTRLIETNEEVVVDLCHFFRKKLLQQIKPLATTVISTPLPTMNASFRGRFRRRKYTASSGGFSLESADVARGINNRPANRSRANAKTDVVRFDLSQIHASTLLHSCYTACILIPVKMSLRVKIKA